MKKRFPVDARNYAECIVNTMRESLLVLDSELRIISANASFYKTFKVTRAETEGQSIFALGDHQWDIPRLRELLEKILPKSNTFEDYEVEHKFPNIGLRTMLLNARRIFKQTHKTKLILLAIEDISKRKRLENALNESHEALRYTSYHDALTGLYNRAYYEEEMSRLGKDLSRSRPISMISIDIDGLKLINDTRGHKAGDELLVSAAKIISAPFRKIDVVARIGGDEFCILLPKTDHPTVLAKKRDMLKWIARHNAGNPATTMKMSIGVATSRDLKAETIYTIYQRADKNMYKTKAAHTRHTRKIKGRQ